MPAFKGLRTLIITFVLCASLDSVSVSVFADGGIRVHRANQFHKLKKNLNKSHRSSNHSKNKRDSRYRYYHNFRQQVVPDSRFPNSYRDYSYYQKLQSQYYRDR